MVCQKHKKAVRGETVQQKQQVFFTKLERKSDNAVLAAEGAFPFHTMKHSSYKTTKCVSVLFKIIFPDSEIA
jgi:hypothetical protein